MVGLWIDGALHTSGRKGRKGHTSPRSAEGSVRIGSHVVVYIEWLISLGILLSLESKKDRQGFDIPRRLGLPTLLVYLPGDVCPIVQFDVLDLCFVHVHLSSPDLLR